MYRREFLTGDRNKDLYETFRKLLDTKDVIILNDILTLTVNSPAKRFYVSADRVYGVLVRWASTGVVTRLITPERQEMFEDLYKIVAELRKEQPTIPLLHIIERAIEYPAPKFYIKPDSAKIILCKYKQFLKKQHTCARA